jgi:adenine deaminase
MEKSSNAYTVSGQIVDVVAGIIFQGDIVVEGSRIKQIIPKQTDNKNFILPGLIDAHVHVESSMLVPEQFAKLAVQHGTVAVISDPHEIANVLGVEGVNFMIENAKNACVKFFFGAPSCVPATAFESSGAVLNALAIEQLLTRNDIYFLSEMMNFPGVLNGNSEVENKIKCAHKLNKKIDGHAPGLTEEQILIYSDAGISTDHECTTIKEAELKIKHGMKIQIREGSAAKNFDILYPLIDRFPESVMLCTDDSHPDDIEEKHINDLIIRGLKKGLKLMNLLRAASLNPVQHYNIPVGLLQLNDPADFIIIDNFEDFNILNITINGEIINRNISLFEKPIQIINNFQRTHFSKSDIIVKNNGKYLKVICAEDGNLSTSTMLVDTHIFGEFIESNIEHDLLKIVVVNRYDNLAKPVVGFIKNFGLKSGAISSSVAHDSHNIIAVGCSDEAIEQVINKIINIKGGIALSHNNTVDFLKLPIAGLMSNDNPHEVAAKYKFLNQSAINDLGSGLKNPFMTLSFMALLVIPELKIGDKGLFDSQKFEFTSLII